MKFFHILLPLVLSFILIPVYGLPNCGTPPKLVFILDDSGSIDDIERGQMANAIQKIVDGVEASYPDTQIATVQYVQEGVSTPQEGKYGISMNYTNNPAISVIKSPVVPLLGQDHLPDSINQMITDGIFNPGGVLEEPDMFFIFTDAARSQTGICCSVLENTGDMASTDAASGFGEYSKLAQLSSSGDISLYQILTGVGQETPEIAQGSGIYRSGADFIVSQTDIDAIVSNIVANVCPDTSSNTFSCTADSEAYMFQISGSSSGNSQVSTLNLGTGEFSGSGPVLNAHINSQGYNIKDNYIWGYNVTKNDGSVSRIDALGVVTDYIIPGLPKSGYLTGDVDSNGHLYLYAYGSTIFHVVDVNPSSATFLTLLKSVNMSGFPVGDWAFNPIDGQIYGVTVFDDHSLVRLNPITGVVDNLGLTGIPSGGVIGAIYFDSDGFMYAYYNTDGKIYRIDISDPSNVDPQGIYFSQGISVVNNDGARCNLVPVLIDFGDAPDSYGTTLVSNGARHTFKSNSTLYLGSNRPDREADAQITTNAGGDDANNSDDEDAFVTLPDIDPTSTSYEINVPCSGSGKVAGWVDFNQSGAFELGERAIESCTSGNAFLGWYGLSGLSAGQTYARFRIASDVNELINPVGVASDGEVEDYPVTITGASCTAFTGEVTEVNLPITSQLKTADKLFVPSRSTTSPEGHLRAYTIDASGVPSSTADWDVANVMSSRSTRLYSTDDEGDIVSFSSLTDELSSTIVDYTVGADLGGISRGNSLEILTNTVNTSLYLYDKSYRDFYTTISSRTKQVLVTNDDGFLYAFNYDTGNLSWAWMPRSLIKELTGLADYQSKHLMAGTVDILDLKDSSGTYATYIVGSYKSGLGRYVLKLNKDGSLNSVVWDSDQSGAFIKSPNNGAMEFFEDGSGLVYAASVLTNSANTSRLSIKSITDSSTSLDVDLNYNVTSVPFIMQDYGRSNAPAKKTLYLGTETGDIHMTSLLTTGGVLETDANIKISLESVALVTMDDNPTDEIIYIDSSISARDNQYYLTAQTPTRLSVLKYDSSTSSWKKKWTSYASGAGSWSGNETYSADTSGAPSGKGVQSLPVDAIITDKAVIVADTIVLPISVLPASSTACYGKAYYYMYSLVDGFFPKASFVKTDNTAIETNIVLGYGEARKLTISDLLIKDKFLGYGIADKKADFSIGLDEPFIIKDPVATGVRGWKELGR